MVGGELALAQTSNPPTPRTSLAFELEVFRTNLRRIRDCLLNHTFDLTLSGAQRRQRTLSVLFILILSIVTVALHPSVEDWTSKIRDIFLYLFNPAFAQTYNDNPFTKFLLFAIGGSWTNLLRYLPIFLFPYQVAIHLASLYLADIFEKPVNIARSFICVVALLGGSETVKIIDGEFLHKNESRIYAIGGPGYVEVDRNSVVLFEKPDGRPHVIGPTVNGRVLLDGFERFRSVIDLRDQQFDLRDQDNREIASRTLNGIKVSAMDVSMRFSIWRGAESQRTLKDPNPYKNDEIIQNLVYNQSLPISKDSKHKEGSFDIPSPIGPPMVSSIRGELSRFMSERNLTEFFASFGSQELLAESDQVSLIQDETLRMLPVGTPPLGIPTTPPPPAFTPRPDLSARFSESFADEAHRKGVHLDWIGVGTWKTPDEIIPQQHLEAWRLSSENSSAMNTINSQTEQANIQETIKLVQEIIAEKRYLSTITNDSNEIIKKLLEKYRGQLKLAWDIYQRERTFPPAELREALRHILRLVAYFVGSTVP
jgi:hypothetical protein